MAEQSSADYRGNLGRYALFGEIAAGGMATVHLARLIGSVGFSRTCAIKRLHPHLAKDPDFVAMFLEEARLAARVQHPNVVGTLDVVSEDGELFLVMEYVAGESLSRLIRKTREAGNVIPARHVIGVMCGSLEGLHAAHEAKSEKGLPLGMVHRDISPQNIHVGVDGVARVLDFGIAKATNRVQETRTDQIKGKVAYMSPEQLAKGAIDRRADVYSASVVLWEALTGQRLFKADDVPSLVYSIINDEVRKPSSIVPNLPAGLDDVIMKGLDREATNRWGTAREMAEALERLCMPSPPREIGQWVQEVAGEALAWRLDLVHRIESETTPSIPPPLRRDSPAGPIEVASGVSGVVPNRSEPPPALTMPAEPAPPRIGSESLADIDFTPEQLEGDGARSWMSIGLMILAGVLLLSGGGFLLFRWVQLQGDGTTAVDPAPRAPDSAEPAIAIQPIKPVGSVSARPTATPPQPPPSPVAPIVTTVAPAATAVRKHDDCSDPFVVDSKGIRHPKPSCFKR